MVLFISISSIVICRSIILKDVQTSMKSNIVQSTITTVTTQPPPPPPLQEQPPISLPLRNNNTTTTRTREVRRYYKNSTTTIIGQPPQSHRNFSKDDNNHNHVGYGNGYTYGSHDIANVDATIVVHLSGEMGNHLHHLVHGYGIHLMLLGKDDNDMIDTSSSNAPNSSSILTNIILRHQEHVNQRKWMSAQTSIQSCFPHFRNYNFSFGNTIEFYNDKAQQVHSNDSNVRAINNTLLDESFNGHCNNNNHFSISSMKLGVDYLRDVIVSKEKTTTAYRASTSDRIQGKDGAMNDGSSHTSSSTTTTAAAADDHSRSYHNNKHFPIVINSTCMSSHAFLDRYYDTIRSNYLYYDEQACCTSELPEPDETVFVRTACIDKCVCVCVFLHIFAS